MYELAVRDQMMIAHSFASPVFGPARALHGATYVVDVTFARPELDADDLVVDIGAAARVLHEILAEFHLGNLDDHAEFVGRNTTTEFMARVVYDRMKGAIAAGRLGEGARGLTRLRVRLGESPTAWAAYEAGL